MLPLNEPMHHDATDHHLGETEKGKRMTTLTPRGPERRSGIERRKVDIVPKVLGKHYYGRSGEDRRSGLDRRSALDGRSR